MKILNEIKFLACLDELIIEHVQNGAEHIYSRNLYGHSFLVIANRKAKKPARLIYECNFKSAEYNPSTRYRIYVYSQNPISRRFKITTAFTDFGYASGIESRWSLTKKESNILFKHFYDNQ